MSTIMETATFIPTKCPGLTDYKRKLKHGTVPTGERSGKTKLRNVDVLLAVQLLGRGYSHDKIAKRLNTPKSTISGILRGRTWAHLTGIKYAGQR